MTRIPSREARPAARAPSPSEAVPLEEALGRVRETIESLPPLADAADVLRITQPIDALDEAAWLAAQPPGSRVYWSDRERRVVRAGIDSAWRVEAEGIESLLDAACGWLDAHPDATAFLSARFDPDAPVAEEWRSFAPAVLRVPAIEIVTREGSTTLDVTLTPATTPGARARTIDLLDAVRPAADRAPRPAPVLAGALEALLADDPPAAWVARVRDVLGRIGSGELEKVVLARHHDVPLAARGDGVAMAAALAAAGPGTYVYLVESDGAAFVGASPELLYRRTGERIASEALAGTRPRGATVDEDGQLADDLVASEKEQREHAIVVDHVRAALGAACAGPPRIGPREIRRLGTVQHLAAAISGARAEGTHDGTVLAALHPTPAVCGRPRARALEALRAGEPFDRGLYGGPIGTVSRDGVTLAVALRCALVYESGARLYAGAGIVEGSTPASEWRETGAKLRALGAVLESA